MEYFLFVFIFIIIGISVSLIFSRILHIKVFGGGILMFIIATSGALLGAYYLPLLANLRYIKIDLSSAILGAIILIILLHIFTPKSLK